MNSRTIIALIAIAAITFVAGCDKKSNPVSDADAGTYVGTFVSVDTTAGLIILTVESSGKASGSALLFEDSLVTVGINGNVSNNTLTATATDGTPIVGTLSGGTITGTAANGEATFSLKLSTSAVVVQVYFGTYASTSGVTESGELLFCTAATTMWGVVIESGGSTGDYLIGTVMGTSVSVHSAFDASTEVASGTKSGNTWSGTYTGQTSSGTWSVTLVQ